MKVAIQWKRGVLRGCWSGGGWSEVDWSEGGRLSERRHGSWDCISSISCNHKDMDSISNGFNPQQRFRVRVWTGPEPWQRFYNLKNPDRWHLGRFPHQNPAIGSPDNSLQLSIWDLIIVWHDQYIDCAVLAARSPPAFRFVIRPILVESLSKTH